jgi:RNA polymerase sigma-70 factor (ECF subfamily)
MAELADNELIVRIVEASDRDAFALLVRRHQSPVRSLLRKLTCGDHAFADDLAQETFLRAYLKLHTFRRESSFGTWLYRIAYNAFLAEIRRRSPLRQADGELPEPSSSRSAQQALVLDLERAMAGLTEAERAAIDLCYKKDMSHQEAAFVLDCPVGTVKTHILRGKEKLRKLLSTGAERSAP